MADVAQVAERRIVTPEVAASIAAVRPKCTGCAKQLPIEEFSIRNTRTGLRHRRCVMCLRNYHKRHYADNKAYYKSKCLLNAKRSRARIQAKILEYLESHPCVDCGEKDPIVLEFDHIRGRKIEGIAVMLQQRRPWERIEKEIQKCDVRCANCHKRRTHVQSYKGSKAE